MKEETFKALSIMAVQHGTNLKNYIETILDQMADEYDDTLIFEYLVSRGESYRKKMEEFLKRIDK